MPRRTRRPLLAVATFSLLALGAATGTAAAQTTQSGLVNVSLTDPNVQVPVGVAAAVCGVQANVIAADAFGGNALCDATSRVDADHGGSGGGNTTQEGLVNVSLTDTNVQVPVGVAADVCGISANVLAAGTFGGNAVCTSATRAQANH
jgi:hypothetical protein